MYILDSKTGCDFFILMEEPSEGFGLSDKGKHNPQVKQIVTVSSWGSFFLCPT